MKKLNLSNLSGALLLEALIVIVILSVGLTFIIQSMTSSMRELSFSLKYDQASVLLDNKLSESMLLSHFKEDIQESSTINAPEGIFNFKLTDANLSWPTESSPSESLKTFKYEINWDIKKRTHDIIGNFCLFIPSMDKT